jgi:WD40 repeat protein
MSVTVQKIHSFTGHRDSVYTLQPSSDPAIFFSAAGDGMVVQWDLRKPDEGELVARLNNSVYALHYHAPTDQLIVGHNYDGIHIIDWRNKREAGSLQLTKAAIFDIQSLGDIAWIATGEGELIRVNLSSLVVEQRIQSSVKNVRTLAILESQGEIAAGYSDHTIRVFDMKSGVMKHEWKAHNNSVFTLRYSPDGAWLMSGSRDARIKVWNARDKYAPVTEVVAHLYAINHLDFSPDSKHFVTCSMDKSIKVWDLAAMKLLKVIDRARHAGHGTSVNRLLWTSHQQQLISASDDRTISVWDIHIDETS